MITQGSLVSIDESAFEYAGLDYDQDIVGLVVSKSCARRSFNLDTDEQLCEVIISDGRVCVFYEVDLLPV
jgi:hypothetical protein|tara:strand:+ start:277 stop:486 length:210 start_codon:yes stop_codon:yes gene_type:complete